MRIRKALALRGRNVWAGFPVLEVWLEREDQDEASPCECSDAGRRLLEHLPGLNGHREAWTGPPSLVMSLALELQNAAGCAVTFAHAGPTSLPHVERIVVAYQEEAVGRAALDAAIELLARARAGREIDVAQTVAALRTLYHEVKFGPSTGSIVEGARSRGIPVRRLQVDSLVQLGWGRRQRRIWASASDQTASIAAEIAQDKDLTRRLLRDVGVPVPYGREVTNADEAWTTAEEIGLPVVVKPRYGNQGKGVATNLTTRDQVLAAFQAASTYDPKYPRNEVVVEQFAPGDDYRVLVIGGRMAAAARREPAQVVGDGRNTIAMLVDEINRDPRRGDDHATALSKIVLDDPTARAVLADQGFTPDSVPPPGQRVLIRRNANLSTGGTATDVTDSVHPEVAARAIEAARVVGLDIAGVDIIATDIARPLEEQGGIIVEVNASPGLRMHLEPSSGTPRPVGDMIIDMMFPEGETARVPIAAVTGTNGKTTTVRLIAHILRQTGRHVGMTCTEGVYLDGRCLSKGDCSGPQSAQAVLSNPIVEAAVLETARGGILRAGLGFDRCDVAVVTNIGEGDHLGMSDIETLDDLARVKRVIVEAVAPNGTAVLNAADPLVVGMAAHCEGSVFYYAQHEDNAVLRAHRQAGGKVAFVRDGQVVLAEGPSETPIVRIEDVPLTCAGRIGFHVENTIAATAAAWSMGVSLNAIRLGLTTFGSGAAHSPGRFNLLEINGATVILDYGHNESALHALIEAIERFPHSHRAVVYTAAGDRRDQDIIRQGEVLGNAFDHVILYEDACTRGRPDGEVIALLRQGLALGRRVTQITESPEGEFATQDRALRAIQPGQLILVQVDMIDEAVRAILDNFGKCAELDGPSPASPAANAFHHPTTNGPAVTKVVPIAVLE